MDLEIFRHLSRFPLCLTGLLEISGYHNTFSYPQILLNSYHCVVNLRRAMCFPTLFPELILFFFFKKDFSFLDFRVTAKLRGI